MADRLEIIIGIVIFTMLFLFLMIVIFASGTADPVSQPINFNTETGLFLSPCTSTPCLNGLVCDGTDFTCRSPAGTICNSYADCVSGLICSGVCTAGPPGNLNNPCPCNPGFICVDRPPNRVCKVIPGLNCNTNDDCSTNNCINGFCSAQPPPSTDSQGILFVCTSSRGCTGNTVCYGTGGTECGSSSPCLCYFPYQDVNSAVSGSCIGGMTNSNGSCLNNVGLPCGGQGDCSSLFCGGGSTLSVYSFNNIITTNFVGATNTSIIQLSSGPVDPVGNVISSPYKMFGNSSGLLDTIYDVDHGLGLQRFDYNYSNSSSSGWSTIIPLTMNTSDNSSTLTLIDAALGPGSVFYILFRQRVISSGNNFVVAYTLTNGLYAPYNSTAGATAGVQFDSGGNAIMANYIDVSSNGDVLLVSGGVVYSKFSTDFRYTQRFTGAIGPVYYYSGLTTPVGTGSTGTTSTNIAFVGPLTVDQISFSAILQFQGTIKGAALPVDPFRQLDYSVYDYSIFSTGDMSLSQIIMLTNSSIGLQVALSNNATRTLFPQKISLSCRSCATANAFYVLSPSSCS